MTRGYWIIQVGLINQVQKRTPLICDFIRGGYGTTPVSPPVYQKTLPASALKELRVFFPTGKLSVVFLK